MNKISIKYIFTIIIISLFFYNCDRSEIEKELNIYSKLEGHVYNEFDQPLPDATISVNNYSHTSDSSGYYYFEKVIVGKHIVTVSRDGFIEVNKNIEIVENSMLTVNFKLLNGSAFIVLSDSLKELNSPEGNFSLNISSNTNWHVENTSDWISTSLTSGKGNSSLRIEYLENNTDEVRSDTVKIFSGDIHKNIVLTQDFSLKIVETKGLIANQKLNIVDSFMVRFNKPVQSVSINSFQNTCFSDISHVQSEDKKTVTFSFSCAELGGSYSFTVYATDLNGSPFIQNITVPLFALKRQFEGYITDFYLMGSTNEMYISTINPNGGRIYHYSIESDSVLKSFDLTGIVAPYKFSLNPFNNKLYIIGASPDYDTNTGSLDPSAFTSTLPIIYILNPNIGEVEDSIEILTDELDHPQHPCNIPTDIGFTNSGMCIMSTKANEASYLRWKFLDTSNNNKIYFYTDNISSDFYSFSRVYENYDHTKLFLMQPYGGCSYGLYDDTNKELSILRPSSITSSYDLIPNRKKDIIYIRQLRDQFIINLQGEIGAVSHLDSRPAGGADFDYSDETFQTIFVYEAKSFVGNPNEFNVLDYSSGTTVLKCDALDEIYNFTTTIDGKWAVAYSLDYPNKSFLSLFDTKMLKREN
ncbi:MAG: carboxypeptidase regulatory-like domain-containing protein [bacterium]